MPPWGKDVKAKDTKEFYLSTDFYNLSFKIKYSIFFLGSELQGGRPDITRQTINTRVDDSVR